MAQGTSSPSGPAPTAWTAPPQRRFRFRNFSDAPIRLYFYNRTDRVQVATLPNGRKTIDARAELAYPEREFTGPGLPTIRKVAVQTRDGAQLKMSAGQPLTIAADGSMSVGSYVPPPRDRR